MPSATGMLRDKGLRVRIWQRPAGMAPSTWPGFAAVPEEVCWPFVTPVGSELLRCRWPPDVRVTACIPRIQPTVPCSSCRELERQLLGEVAPRSRLVGWSSVLCSSACPFESGSACLRPRRPCRTAWPLFQTVQHRSRGWDVAAAAKSRGRGPGQLSLSGRACRPQRAACQKYAWSRSRPPALGVTPV